MLLRSASTPILKSCNFLLSSESDLSIRIHTPTRSISMHLSSSSIKKIPRTLSDGDLKHLHISKKKTFLNKPLTSRYLVENEEGEGEFSTYNEKASCLSGGLVLDEGSGGGGGGGNGGVLDGGGGGDGNGDSGKWSESMEMYYQKMIKAYPEDALILANYAKFLKELRGDSVKAEEYCERAILAKPDDGNVLSFYGDLIWNNHKDATRAKSYFDQAVQSAPDDCYVLASYARFLWDAGEEEEEEEDENVLNYVPADSAKTCASQPNVLPPLTTAY